jgi:hypothetical protein
VGWAGSKNRNGASHEAETSGIPFSFTSASNYRIDLLSSPYQIGHTQADLLRIRETATRASYNVVFAIKVSDFGFRDPGFAIFLQLTPDESWLFVHMDRNRGLIYVEQKYYSKS